MGMGLLFVALLAHLQKQDRIAGLMSFVVTVESNRIQKGFSLVGSKCQKRRRRRPAILAYSASFCHVHQKDQAVLYHVSQSLGDTLNNASIWSEDC